jgi:Chaperone of endosialidase
VNQTSRIEIDNAIARKIYATPSLTNYGLVRELTQSGTGMASESNAGGSGCITDPTRKPCSEIRVKENISRIGDHTLGFGLYLFDYRPEYREQWGHGRQFGVMIDEVETIVPEAVSVHPDGFKRVDYAMLGIERFAH